MASEGSNEKREGERVGSALRLKLKYTDVDTFVEKFATNISKGGVFIASRTPKPVGTPLRFELTLENGQRLIKGEGTVSSVKEFDPKQPTKAHGMGLKFTKLDNESRVLVDRMLAIKQRREDARSAAGEGPVTAVTPELTPVLAQPGPSPAKKPGPPPLPPPAATTGRNPAVDFEANDPTRADSAPMTIMMDVGTSGIAVRRDAPSKAVPPPLPPRPAPPPLPKGAAGSSASLTTVTGGWDAASRTAPSPLPPEPPPLAPPPPEPLPPEPVKTNGAHAEHADFDDATRDDPTLLVALPEFQQPAAAPPPPSFEPAPPAAFPPAASPAFVPPAFVPAAPSVSMPPPRLPDPVVAGDVEALLAHADRELAELAVDPVALEQAGRRAHELSAGVDLDTLLSPEPPPAATLAEATRALSR